MKRSSMPWYELTIRNDGNEFRCPVELFTEVVDFLTEKGIIKSKSPIGPVYRGKDSGSKTPPSNSTIPLPVIDGVREDIENQGESQDIDVSPFTSFDNSLQEIEEEIEQVAPADDETPKEVSAVKVGGKKISSEIISRPVIRSRVGDSDDPLAAEREAALLRGQQEGNFRRSD
jgi:hypothetical protein